MPDTTTLQSLPLIMPSQAQKHVTHNEAMKILDVLTQLTVSTRTRTAPPSSPVTGESHIVAAAATGAWAGQTGKVAVYYGLGWEFYAPLKGWQAYIVAEAEVAVYTGTAWAAPSESPAEFSQLGVSTSPDATNRLAVSSPATLLNHAGAGHQVKINKATSADTASVMFQTGFSGRAEMGTAGNDDFAIKVSADGSTFTEALSLDRATGRTKVQKGLRITPAAGDLASPVDGEIWYNSTTAKLRTRQNGASTDVVGGTFSDAAFTLQDDGDATKQGKFQLAGLTTATTRTYTLPNATGTVVLLDATQSLTNKTINLSSNTITGTMAATNIAMTGGGTAQDYAGFTNRGGFVTWASGKTPATGTVIDAAGYAYRYIGTGTAISDLPGWVPMGLTYPDHWAQNLTPGTTNMQPAIISALAYSATVYLAGGIYAVGSTVAWDNSTLIGNNDRGAARTRIQGLSASMPIGSAIVAPGRSSTIRAVQIGYDTLTGTETQDQRVGLDCRGLTQVLQRGSVIDEVVFDNVGTGISDYGVAEFSVTYGTLEVVRHSYRAVDIRGTERTGSIWLNLYINGGTTYTPEGGFCLTGQGAGGMIGQLNIEHGAYSGYPVRLEGLQGLVINSLHIEGVDCTTTNFGYVGLDSCSVTIQSANILNSRMSTDNTAVFRLARAGYQSTAVPTLLTNTSQTSNLKIGKLNVKGLATPFTTLYPTYPGTRTGVRNCAGFNLFKRDTSYTDSNWLVEVQDYLWATYAAQAADRPFLEFPDVTYSGNIQVRRVGERGSNVVPYDNYVLNGAYDKWLTTTATVTNGATEVATKWTLRGSTGSMTVDRVQDSFGAIGQFDARITVNTAGTAQSWDQDIGFPVEWLGQPLRLSFDMRAATAGRVLEQITATLINNGGGSPATVVKQVLNGTDNRLDATTAFKTYVLDFTGVDPVSVTTLGTAAVMRLSFQFNNASAVRAPVVTFSNVSLSRLAGVKFARAPYDRLALAAADVAGLGALATAASVNLTTQATGTLPAAQMPAHTGDVTNPAGSLATTIAAGAVSLPKMANLAANSVIANLTGSAAVPAAVAASSLTVVSSIATRDGSGNIQSNNFRQGYATTATAGGTTTLTVASPYLQFLTGTLAQTVVLPVVTTLVLGHQYYIRNNSIGFVTVNSSGGNLLRILGPGTRAIVTCIAVTGTTAASWSAMYMGLSITDGKVVTVQNSLTLSGTDGNSLAINSVGASVSGANTGDQTIALTGDVTGSGTGSFAATIATNAVSLAKMAQTATATILGRATAGTGNVEALTATQTTALLDAFSSTTKGLVPASGGGTTSFLRADGSFAAPGPSGTTTQVQFNNAGVAAGASEVLVEDNQLRLPVAGTNLIPASGGVKLIGRADAGRTIPAFLNQDGVLRGIQTALSRNSPVIWKAVPGSGSLTTTGSFSPTVVGTATGAQLATTNLHTMTPKLEYLVTTASTTAVAGFFSTTRLVSFGGTASGLGGFHFIGRWGPATGVATTTSRVFFGMGNSIAAPTDVEPSTQTLCVGMGWDAADTNIQIMCNDASGTCTKTDLGASFAVPTTDRTALYELALFNPKGTTASASWLVTDLVSGATASGSITTDLPPVATLMAPRGWMSVGGTSSVIGFGLNSLYLDPLL